MTAIAPITDTPDMIAFGAPGRYLQGPHLLAKLGELLQDLGCRPLVLLDTALYDSLSGPVVRGLGALAATARLERFMGECTAAAIDVAAAAGRAHGADLVIGVGGGKAIDTAKGARMQLGSALAVVPTIASNDSPTSRLVVIYDAQHVLVETRMMRSSPDLVLVDTALIAGAPVRFLLAGIGDAITKKFEAREAIAAGGRNFFGGRGGGTAQAIADHCYTVIRRDAEAALSAAARGLPDAAFERLVEACVLGSGLGFESGGLSIAHSMLRGFSRVPSLARALHGEQVAVGLLVQLHAGEPGLDIAELLAFYRRIGLPTTLAELGMTESLNEAGPLIAQHVFRTAPYIRNFQPGLTEAGLLNALKSANTAALASN